MHSPATSPSSEKSVKINRIASASSGPTIFDNSIYEFLAQQRIDLCVLMVLELRKMFRIFIDDIDAFTPIS